ncbi:MAG: xylulokinase [Clostridiales bacterium]|nr:xylulokinase [Clostridiales bacterium]
MKYVIGIDLGTSGTKTVLFDASGRQGFEAEINYPLYQPHNGWAEQDALDWRNACFDTIRQVIKGSGVDRKDIVGIGISGQMQGLVMLDEADEVLRRSIIWADQRTGEECRDIEEIVGRERLMDITLSPALTGFTLSKILWVRKHEPEIYKRCRQILLPKDYLRYCLTGDFATEVSDASGTQLLDIKNRDWSEELLTLLDIDPALLPRVYESPEITGYISREAAKQTGLSTSTAVVGGAGDNAAAAVGTGVVREGRAFTTIGTSGVVFAHTDDLKADPQGRIHSFCCAVPGAWHVMGVTQSAGLSLQWLRNNFYPEDQEYEKINQDIAQTPVGAERLLFTPYLMGDRTPHLDPLSRGAFVGLSAMHTKKHMARAVMEGVCFALKESQTLLTELGVCANVMSLCGGGAKSPVFRQMLADVYRLPCNLPLMTNSAALGVAILAAVGCGMYSSVPEACDEILKFKEAEKPDEKNAETYRQYYEVYRGIYPALKETYLAMSKL